MFCTALRFDVQDCLLRKFITGTLQFIYIITFSLMYDKRPSCLY